jgi:hypothetical protein
MCLVISSVVEIFLCGNLRQRSLEVKLELLSERLRDLTWAQVCHLVLLKYSLFFLVIHTRITVLSISPPSSSLNVPRAPNLQEPQVYTPTRHILQVVISLLAKTSQDMRLED